MTHQQFLDKYQGEPYKHECDCGRPGVHKFARDWECERCRRLRMEQSRELSVRGVVAARPVGLSYGRTNDE